jgi:hypothetical protein
LYVRNDLRPGADQEMADPSAAASLSRTWHQEALATAKIDQYID